ncbi:MAG: hypothetical protein H6579_01710 [Chitinophagales bacterium]|nr:hypothetical protein [Bacteroidota bacterium]MCB9255827.1 hypothetical protein [Chitinophagales bacterium]
MSKKLGYLFLLLLSISCNFSGVKDLELQEFSKVEVREFKKKNVQIYTNLRFLNPNENSIKVVYAEFDVFVNGKDIGTFISKKEKSIAGKGLYEIPIVVDFLPEDAFKNLDYGIKKIKSDVACDVKLVGYLKTLSGEKEDKISYDFKQKVLFTNNDKLYLDENFNIKEK